MYFLAIREYELTRWLPREISTRFHPCCEAAEVIKTMANNGTRVDKFDKFDKFELKLNHNTLTVSLTFKCLLKSFAEQYTNGAA